MAAGVHSGKGQKARKTAAKVAKTTTKDGKVTLYGEATVKDVCKHLEYDPLKSLIDVAKSNTTKQELKIEIAGMLLPYVYGHTMEEGAAQDIPTGQLGIFVTRVGKN